MSRRSRRRREARRKARQHGEERQEVPSPAEEAGPSGPAEREREEPARAAAEARLGRAARKRAKRKGGVWSGLRRMRVSPWLIGMPVVATVVVVVVVLALSGGSSGSEGSPEATPDPRVAGLTPTASISVEVDDVNFNRTTIPGPAGEVIELVVTNTGTISHNLVVAGLDDEYDTDDDFEPQPFAIKPGDTGRVVLKIDDPGTYRFRCAFHPTIEFGTLVLE